MASDDFSPPPGVQAEQIIVASLGQQPAPQTGIGTNKNLPGQNNSSIVQDTGLKTPEQIAFDNKITERKQKLDEARFRLEEKKTMHDMQLELQRENFAEKQVKLDREAASGAIEEHWLQKYWRPAAGWIYMAICAMDFIIFPLLSIMMPVIYKSFGYTANYVAWQSLTLQNGGLIHMAFGAILGVAAYTRGMATMKGMTPLGTSANGTLSVTK